MPLFISFEGPDGSGKSTQARLLGESLRARGFRVTETREPGGTPIGERVREIFLNPEAPAATPLVMTFLLSAARSQHVTDVIEPALRQGNIVISDRFADSTLAYQAFGEGVALEEALQLTDIATRGVAPDVTIYVDISPEIGLQRVDTRGARNRLDAKAIAFHCRVREGYSQLMRQDPERWIRIDGSAAPDAVHHAIVTALEPVLEREAETI